MQTLALDVFRALATAYSPAYLFQDYFPIVVIVLTAIALLSIKAENKIPLLLAILLSVTMVPVLKAALNEQRPCNGNGACPPDAGFPSGHSSIAAIFAAASLGSVSFYAFFPIGILIAASRITSGVHTLQQVAGGIATGMVLFFLSKAVADFALEAAFKKGLLPSKRGIQTLWQKKRVAHAERDHSKKPARNSAKKR